jgi:hypothetical protein
LTDLDVELAPPIPDGLTVTVTPLLVVEPVGVPLIEQSLLTVNPAGRVPGGFGVTVYEHDETVWLEEKVIVLITEFFEVVRVGVAPDESRPVAEGALKVGDGGIVILTELEDPCPPELAGVTVIVVDISETVGVPVIEQSDPIDKPAGRIVPGAEQDAPAYVQVTTDKMQEVTV